MAAARAMLDKNGARTLLLVQASSPGAGTFVRMPSVMVLAGAGDWDPASIRNSHTTAAGRLWTTSQLGAAWVPAPAGRHAIERLDGLGTLLLAHRGRLLFLSNDSRLLAAVLGRAGIKTPAAGLTCAAGFRHARERSNYERVMAALDFTSSAGNPPGSPAFLSANIASLSRVLSKISRIDVAEQEKGLATLQTVRYETPNR